MKKLLTLAAILCAAAVFAAFDLTSAKPELLVAPTGANTTASAMLLSY